MLAVRTAPKITEEGIKMPQAVAHFLVIEEALKDTQPLLWAKYYPFAVVGSFAPDMFYAKTGMISQNPFFARLANKMHAAGALDCCCELLDTVKNEKNPDNIPKLKALAYGYCAHILTDVIFHPFVYRKTGDHWLSHLPKENHAKHKEIETFFDHYLLGANKQTEFFQLWQNFTACGPVQGELDSAVADALHKSISEVYAPLFADNEPDENIFKYYFGGLKPTEDAHPLQQAFKIYSDSIKSLYKLEEKPPQVPGKLKDEWTNEKHEQWLSYTSNVGLNYSAEDLFAMAVKATKKAIEDSEAFLNGKNNNSKDSFQSQATPYLNENYNLDTGLPSSKNAEPDNTSADPEIRYAYGVEKLIANYELLQQREVF